MNQRSCRLACVLVTTLEDGAQDCLKPILPDLDRLVESVILYHEAQALQRLQWTLRRAADQTPLDLRDIQGIRRHQPLDEVVAGLEMVCANPACGHVLDR